MFFDIRNEQVEMVKKFLKENHIQYSNYFPVSEYMAESDAECALEALEDKTKSLSYEQKEELFNYIKRMALNYDYSEYNEYLLDCGLAKISEFEVKTNK